MLHKHISVQLLIFLVLFTTNFILLSACQWAGGTPDDPVKSQSQTPRPEWVDSPAKRMDPDHPKSTFFVEKKRYVTDLSYGLKQAQSAALQKHHGGQILSVYWEQRQDYTIWVLVASSAPLTP